MSDAINLLTNMFSSLFEIVDSLFTGFDIYTYLFGAFFCITAYRLLLKPILGGGSGRSDTVRKNKGKGEDNG